jgi:hypothetical protein
VIGAELGQRAFHNPPINHRRFIVRRIVTRP